MKISWNYSGLGIRPNFWLFIRPLFFRRVRSGYNTLRRFCVRSYNQPPVVSNIWNWMFSFDLSTNNIIFIKKIDMIKAVFWNLSLRSWFPCKWIHIGTAFLLRIFMPNWRMIRDELYSVYYFINIAQYQHQIHVLHFQNSLTRAYDKLVF